MDIEFFQIAVVFFGYFVLGIAGFGSALIIVPLLAWDLPLSFVVPLLLLMDIPASVLHTGLNFKNVMWRELPPLIPSIVLGAVVGILLLKITTGSGLLLVLGIYVVHIGLKGLQNQKLNLKTGSKMHHVAGFAMGSVETLFGTAGPIVMSWLSTRTADQHRIRATMPMTIIALSLIALGMVGASGGLFKSELWSSLVLVLPVALVGVWSGHQLALRISSERLKPIIYGLLCASGLALCLRALRSFWA